MESIAIEIPRGKMRTTVAKDRYLATRCRSGDPGAFEAVVAQYQASVAGLAYRLLGSAQDLEDVVQDVFLAALVHLPRFRGDCALSTWLMQITINHCRTRLRRHQRRRRWLGWLRRERIEASEDPPPGETADRRHQIRQAVYRLPEKYRVPVVLRYFEHQEIDEIAGHLELSHGAVEVRLSRARRKLRDMLSKA